MLEMRVLPLHKVVDRPLPVLTQITPVWVAQMAALVWVGGLPGAVLAAEVKTEAVLAEIQLLAVPVAGPALMLLADHLQMRVLVALATARYQGLMALPLRVVVAEPRRELKAAMVPVAN